jgi:hypothetical protein
MVVANALSSVTDDAKGTGGSAAQRPGNEQRAKLLTVTGPMVALIDHLNNNDQHTFRKS